MSNKLTEGKRKYIIMKGVGSTTGILRKVLRWWWDTRTSLMSEGEILQRYYDLTEE